MEIRKPLSRGHGKPITDWGESLTQPDGGNATDVNTVVERFQRTGILPTPAMQPQYGDVTGLQGDLTEAINKARADIEQAQSDLRKANEIQQNGTTETGVPQTPAESPAGTTVETGGTPEQ